MTFKLKSVKVGVSFSFAAALTLLCVKSRIYTVCFYSALLHELGHFSALLLMGERPYSIELSAFGMKISRRGNGRLSLKEESVAALAGPAVNLALCVLSLFLSGGEPTAVFAANLGLAVFNLLPVEPLDGGKILYYIICMKTDSISAEKIMKKVTAAGIFPVAVAGFIVLIRSGYNFTLLAAAIYMTAVLLMC